MDDSTSIGLYSISQSISRSRKNLDKFGDNLSSARRFLEIDRARLGFGIRLQLNKEGKFEETVVLRRWERDNFVLLTEFIIIII